MYIIFNKDGSVSESQLTDYINQHSDGVNFIDVSIVGKSVDEYTADGNFKLPNKEVVSLTGSFTNKIKTSTGVYEGYRITLSAVVTEYQGDVALSIQVFNSDKTTLFTYPVTLYVNETTGSGGDPITQDQYEALRAMMADYQLQYARSNMRSYDTLAEANEDLPNLSNGQMILAKETADSETSSVFQKVGDKLEGVSLDGLAVDKFLKKKNAEGEGSFAWYAKGEGAPVDFTIYSETLKQMQEVAGAKQFEPIFKFEGNYVGPANFTLRSFANSPKISINGRSPSAIATSAVFTLDGLSLDNNLIRWASDMYLPVEGEIFLTSRLLGQRGGKGVASLDFDGKIPTSQLPSYVSDVLEFASFDRFPTTGEVNKIYIALDTNKTYRWGGTVYVEIGSSLALGETSETAYAGDKGKRNADNIAALQSEKLNRKSGLSVTPETLVYACEAGGAKSSYADKYIQASLQNIGNSIPITATNGAIYGRSSQVSGDPEIAHVLSYELITKAYADKSYGGLASSNRWTYDNYFAGLTTLTNVVVVGGIASDGGDFIALANDFSEQFGQAFKNVTGFVSPYRISGGIAYEALGFVNENALPDLSKPSVLTYISATGKTLWLDLSTKTMHSYQLPKKSGTIALTSDLSEAGTSVTIRRW